MIIICDIITAVSWVWHYKPSEASQTMYLILFMIPIIFSANLIIAGIVYFIKKYYTPFFIFNSFLSSIILYLFFTLYTEIEIRKEYEEWGFKIDKVYYYISHTLEDNNYRTLVSCGKGCFYGYDRGTVKKQNDTIYFFSVDSAQYYIYKNYLYNFKNIEKIKVKR